MSALFRAAAAVLASCALGAGAVYGTRVLEGRGGAVVAGASGSDIDPDTGVSTGIDTAAMLARFSEGRGARTAQLDAVAEACGGAFVLKRGDVAGVGHVIAFTAHGAGPGALEVRRLSAPGDFMRAEAGAGVLRLNSPDGFEGLAWALTSDAEPQAEPRTLGPARRETLDLACADAAAAAARFNGGSREAGEAGEPEAANTALR
ncbi:hypothetical protein ACWCOP_09030 [Maricaulaceae bacterium MS644]